MKVCHLLTPQIYTINTYLYNVNFLAHIFLSGPMSDVMAGNFMADSVKGSATQKYSPGIQQGIALHRAIDTYTDSHPVMRETKERLRKPFGKYAPVVGDVFYDHFLALAWDRYSDLSLREYTSNTYVFLKDYYEQFPLRTQRFYDYMVQYDILFSYAKIEGIDRVMQGMARRASFVSGMEHSARELRDNYESYKLEFDRFFPEMQQHIRTLVP
jgi:acyl carrier protein phosphodiesterase